MFGACVRTLGNTVIRTSVKLAVEKRLFWNLGLVLLGKVLVLF